jgi:hypothetical protein
LQGQLGVSVTRFHLLTHCSKLAYMVSVVLEAEQTELPWSPGRARHGKQGFRGPGGVRGMENRVSVIPAACKTGFPGSGGMENRGPVVPGASEA